MWNVYVHVHVHVHAYGCGAWVAGMPAGDDMGGVEGLEGLEVEVTCSNSYGGYGGKRLEGVLVPGGFRRRAPGPSRYSHYPQFPNSNRPP